MANNPIVDWVLQSMRDISKMPIKGIALSAITEDGEAYTNYYKVNMADKLLISGLINQDATLDMLAANDIVKYAEDDEEDSEIEETEEKNDG